MSEEQSLTPRGQGKWCPREELGHLIDSAVNNHQRFVRAATDGVYKGPGYQADTWVGIHGYKDHPWGFIRNLWFSHNVLLGAVIQGIPEERLDAACSIAEYAPMPLRHVIEDYVLHMQHHLDLLFRREKITGYGKVWVSI